MKQIIFVCTGNICRSPVAEGIFNKIAAEQGLEFSAVSRGTAGYHVGEKPDYRAIAIAKQNGVDIDSIRAKQITKEEAKESSYIFTVTEKHRQQLLKIAPELEDRIFNLLPFVHLGESIEDPYYGTNQDFANVFDILQKACLKLVEMLKKNRL